MDPLPMMVGLTPLGIGDAPSTALHCARIAAQVLSSPMVMSDDGDDGSGPTGGGAVAAPGRVWAAYHA